MFNRKGEISTVVILGTLVVIGVAALMSSTVNNQANITDTQAAAGCPITNINLEGSVCKVHINYTPGDPQPASPRTLVCALINPARGTTIPNDQLLAGQGAAISYDVFNRSNVGSFQLHKETNFSAKLQPVPADGNYKLVAYDYTNPAGCLKEINISTSTIQSSFGEGPTTAPTTPPATNPPQPTTPPNPTSPIVPSPTTIINNNPTIQPTPTQTISDRTRGNVTPTSAPACRPGQIRCLSGECVEDQGQCQQPTPTQTISDRTRGNVTPTPVSTCRPGQIRCSNGRCVEFQDECLQSTPTPRILNLIISVTPRPTIRSNRIRVNQPINGRVCNGNSIIDNGCIDIYHLYNF